MGFSARRSSVRPLASGHRASIHFCRRSLEKLTKISAYRRGRRRCRARFPMTKTGPSSMLRDRSVMGGALPVSGNGIATTPTRRRGVPPPDAQFRPDRFPGVVGNGIEVLLGDLKAAPAALGRLGSDSDRVWELVPDSDLLEPADRKSHAKTWNMVWQFDVIESIGPAVSSESNVRHCNLLGFA